jgi:hypothetical protein
VEKKKFYEDMEEQLMEQFIIVQKRTARKIIMMCEKKMKQDWDKMLLKRIQPIQIGRKKEKNFSRLEDLESLIL